jgi:uncharacterized oxidoreductase
VEGVLCPLAGKEDHRNEKLKLEQVALLYRFVLRRSKTTTRNTMNMSGNTVLITGGATGIGLGLAESLVKAGNTVLICGRRENKLQEAMGRCSELKTMVCDVADHKDRIALTEWVKSLGVNILVNNAGIQKMIDFKTDTEQVVEGDAEIRCNFEGPVFLSHLLLPHLMTLPHAAIFNVTSGLAFVPLTFMPIYCATKAAMHSFTISLRQQLLSTNVRVVEIIPPIVDTELDRGARAKRGQTNRGITVEQSVAEIMQGMEADLPEIAIGQAANFMNSSNFDEMFQRMNPQR